MTVVLPLAHMLTVLDSMKELLESKHQWSQWRTAKQTVAVWVATCMLACSSPNPASYILQRYQLSLAVALFWLGIALSSLHFDEGVKKFSFLLLIVVASISPFISATASTPIHINNVVNISVLTNITIAASIDDIFSISVWIVTIISIIFCPVTIIPITACIFSIIAVLPASLQSSPSPKRNGMQLTKYKTLSVLVIRLPITLTPAATTNGYPSSTSDYCPYIISRLCQNFFMMPSRKLYSQERDIFHLADQNAPVATVHRPFHVWLASNSFTVLNLCYYERVRVSPCPIRKIRYSTVKLIKAHKTCI